VNNRSKSRAGALVALACVGACCASCALPRADASAPAVPEFSPITPSSNGIELRIRIARDLKTATLTAGGDLAIRVPERPESIRWRGPAVVEPRAPGFIVRSPDGSTELRSAGPVRFEPPAGRILRLDDAEHLGAIELRPTLTPGAFDAIERVGIESYLPGVVAAELYPNWSAGAYEAQAIAARSYALHERSRRRAAGDHYDLENTAIDQAYAGARSSPRARQAVRDTRGLVLTHNGGVLRAYYSSCCGGRPASARDTWPTEGEFSFNLDSPIQAQKRPFACGYSHHFNWSVSRSRAEMAERIAKAGGASGHDVKALRTLDSIRAIEWNDAGRPSLFEVRDASGQSWRIQPDSLRHWSNAAVEGLPDVEPGQRLRSGDVDVILVRDTAQITGAGFGHGVGMCQFGAEGFARRGWTRERILRLYYPGAEITLTD